MTAGFVVGMVAEARIAAKLSPFVFAGGGRAERTRAGAESLLAAGADALISFGIAGGLDPALAPGDLILPASVDGAPVDPRRHADLTALLDPRSIGVIHAADVPIASAVAKAELFRATGAVAVDMESHIVARVAARAAVPFVIIRVIADGAADALPSAALVGLGEDGRPALVPVLASLARHPTQLAALIRVARQSRVALRALDAVAARLR